MLLWAISFQSEFCHTTITVFPLTLVFLNAISVSQRISIAQIGKEFESESLICQYSRNA